LYYPKGSTPELLEEWPVEGDLVVPVEQLPESLRKSMGDRWRTRVKNNEILKEQAK
jgi:ribonuclease Z